VYYEGVTRDYVKLVAKAYADGVDLEEVARRQLAEIDKERLQLQSQAALIRQLQALGSKAAPATARRPYPEVVRAPAGTVPVFSEGTGRLSEELKEQVKAVWTEAMQREKRDLSAVEVVELLTKQGVNFGVEKPSAAVGTVLYAVRNAYKANGQTHIGTDDDSPDEDGHM
jgi:hypothetical protein